MEENLIWHTRDFMDNGCGLKVLGTRLKRHKSVISHIISTKWYLERTKSLISKGLQPTTHWWKSKREDHCEFSKEHKEWKIRGRIQIWRPWRFTLKGGKIEDEFHTLNRPRSHVWWVIDLMIEAVWSRKYSFSQMIIFLKLSTKGRIIKDNGLS